VASSALPLVHRLLPLAACLLLVLVGCARPTASASAPVQTSTVDLPPSYKFAPDHISVSAGTTVTFTNHDNFSHSVKVDGQSDVHLMRPGESAQITFPTPGDFHYVCTLHTQDMQGVVSVT
jgi:plastocyanin